MPAMKQKVNFEMIQFGTFWHKTGKKVENNRAFTSVCVHVHVFYQGSHL